MQCRSGRAGRAPGSPAGSPRFVRIPAWAGPRIGLGRRRTAAGRRRGTDGRCASRRRGSPARTSRRVLRDAGLPPHSRKPALDAEGRRHRVRAQDFGLTRSRAPTRSLATSQFGIVGAAGGVGAAVGAAIETMTLRLRGHPVGWPGGIAPPGSHRTVRDSLPSHGSYHPVGRKSRVQAHCANPRG